MHFQNFQKNRRNFLNFENFHIFLGSFDEAKNSSSNVLGKLKYFLLE